jgi:hypothetical protein
MKTTNDIGGADLKQDLVTARPPIETIIGWMLAVALHPITAWRVLPRRGRWLIPIGYFGAAYVTVLATLMQFAK